MHTEYRQYITVLSVLSALAVVFLHANSCFWGFSYEPYWLSANVIESVFYFAVPIFFMVSGATLIDYNKRYNTKTFFKKRIKKTAIPFIGWSIIGFIYMQYTGRISYPDMGEKALINAFINTNIISIYWYFIPQFAIYLLIPFISAISEERRKLVFGYIIIVMLLFNVTFPLLFQLVGLTYNSALYVPLGGYSLYVFMGYYIDHYEIRSINRKILYVLGTTGLLVHIVGTWKLSYAAGEIISTYKGYLNLPCVLYSMAIYTFFKYHNNDEWMKYLYKWSKPIAGTTLGIYLIHWYLLDWFTRHVTLVSPLSLIYRIPGGIICFCIAAVLTHLFPKIPIIHRIVPR